MTNLKSLTIAASILLAILVAGLAGHLALSQKGNTGVNHALIIGISNYDKFPKLKSPVKDAEEIARILMEKYDFKKENVVLLTDNTKEKPTLTSILTYFDKFVTELTPKDNLLIFFFGHSKEDERGETYWIPKDGRPRIKHTWLKHSDMCKEFFASENFKVKNLCIIADSLFSTKLIKKKAIPLSPYDLRYREKIIERAQRSSREVISFGDIHWDGTKRTEGYGLFAYYLRKSLLNNWLKVIDIENLIFDEKTIFSISKIAGTKLIRGRLRKAPLEKGGQTVITCVISPPIVNVVEVSVSPEKGYQGDQFIVQARTDGNASEVFLEVDGREYPMEGSEKEWKQAVKIASLGKVKFRVTARNGDDIPGKPKTGLITTMKRAARLVNVVQALVAPKKGWGGSDFTFRAVTDAPAKSVALIIGGKRYAMQGADTKWMLRKSIEDVGTLDFSMVAINKDGTEGRPRGGILVVKAPLVDVVEVKAAPAVGYEGQEFLITAKTDWPAKSVFLQLDGVTYPMEGKGMNWRLKRKIRKTGKKEFTVIARNIEGAVGLSKTGHLLAKKRPLALPNIASVRVSPERPYAKENIAIQVKTTVPAEEVYLEIAGRRHLMEGSGTDWKFETQLASIGPSKYKIIAKNREGKQGLPLTGDIITRKRPLPVPAIASVDVSPKKPYTEETFAIRVKTTAPAEKVYVEIAGKQYLMKGKGTDWKFLTQIPEVGTRKFKVIAENKEGKRGSATTGAVTIAKRIAKAVDVVSAEVSPKTGLLGQEYTFKATTSAPARSVALIIEKKRYEMTGAGTQWTLKKKIENFGTLSYSVVAKNEDGVEGGSKIGAIVVKAPPVNVVSVKTSPGEGYAGDDFLITVNTDNPASAVTLEMDGVTYKMKGAGKKWRIKRRITDIGKKQFTVVAKNLEGLAGLSKSGSILTKKRPLIIPDVASVDVKVVSPGKGYVGDTFVIKATTTEPAEEVFVEIEGKRFAMQGAGKSWKYEARIDKLGTSKFTVAALNKEGQQGRTKGATIVTRERPVPIPNVASVEVSATGEGYVGDTFLIKATTTEPAEEVFVEIEGKRFTMEGEGTEWKYLAPINKLGTNKYKIIALNKQGKQGLPKLGEITTTKRPMALVNVTQVEALPKVEKRNFAGSEFIFKAKTDIPATKVTLVIGKERYEMTGSGTEWSLTRKISKPGTLVYYAVAKNEEGAEGGSKTAELKVAELKQRYTYNKDGTITDIITGETRPRFVDNGDGTVTDLATKLMWLKSPKQVALNYEDAVKYCQNLKFAGHEGWRLPTLSEWMGIIDKTRKNPSLPPGHPFVNIPTQVGYWSKTRHKFGPLYVWQVSLWYGKAAHLDKRKNANVWPVRYVEVPKVAKATK